MNKHTTTTNTQQTKIVGTDIRGRTKRKRCRICSQNNLRRNIIFECNACPEKSGICVGNYFVSELVIIFS